MNNLLENSLLIVLTILLTRLYTNYRDHKKFFVKYGKEVPCRRCADKAKGKGFFAKIGDACYQMELQEGDQIEYPSTVSATDISTKEALGYTIRRGYTLPEYQLYTVPNKFIFKDDTALSKERKGYVEGVARKSLESVLDEEDKTPHCKSDKNWADIRRWLEGSQDHRKKSTAPVEDTRKATLAGTSV